MLCIKGMKMPSVCSECVCVFLNYFGHEMCALTGELVPDESSKVRKLSICPLIEMRDIENDKN